MTITRTAMLAATLLGTLSACGGGGSGEAGSGAPAGSGASAAGAKPGATTAAGGGKLIHVKQSKDECTFELDAPEALKESAQDGMSVTLKGTSFSFQGFAGASLYGLDQLTGLATMGKSEPPVVKESANGVNLVVTRNATPSDPVYAVMGQGEEASYKGRPSPLGCSFLCSGAKDKEAEVLAMCRSVRIAYDASKTPK